MTETSSTVATPPVAFTPVAELISASWARTKLTWKNFLLIILSVYAFSFAGVFAIVAVLLGGGALSAVTSGGSEEAILQSLFALAPVGILLFVLFIIAMIVVGTVAGAAMMLAVAKAEEKPSFSSLVRGSMKVFVPMFLTSLLVGLLVFGGIFLFFIPGLIIAIFMSFSTYEVVLADQKYLQAMKNSATMVKQHFGAFFTRYLVIIGISFGISIIDSTVTGIFENSSGLLAIFSIFSAIAQVLFSWFTVSYIYLLYREARIRTDFERPASMTWMWVVSIIGWIIGILLMMVASAGISALVKSGTLQDLISKELQNIEQSGSSSYDQLDSEYGMMGGDSMMEESGEALNADQIIEQYGSEMTEEDKEMLRSIMMSSSESN